MRGQTATSQLAYTLQRDNVDAVSERVRWTPAYCRHHAADHQQRPFFFPPISHLAATSTQLSTN